MKNFISDFFYYLGKALLCVLAVIFIAFTVGAGITGVALAFVICFGGFTWIRLAILGGIVFYYCVLYAIFETVESR